MSYWKYIVMGLLLTTTVFFKVQYDRVSLKFNDYKLTQKILYESAVARNIELGILQDKNIASLIKEHEIKTKDRIAVTTKLKGSINEIRNELTIANDAIKLRNSTSNYPLSKIQTDTKTATSASGNSNELLKTVVDACLITDYDYETLYKAWNEQCMLGLCTP